MNAVREQTVSRRDRLRAETTSEIKTIALELMASGGPDAISLRAIAREMGMTAGALYSYFRTRDDLVTALITDVYTDFAGTVEAARDTATGPADRIVAWAEAVRSWSLANPEGFRLIYGDSVPGYEAPPDSPAEEPAYRACWVLTGLVSDAWPQARTTQTGPWSWPDFSDHLVAQTRADFPDLPPSGLALAIRVWGRVHGLITLEIYGQLGPLANDPTALYRAEIADLIRALNL